MKNLLFIAILLFSVTAFGKGKTTLQTRVGDVLTIGKPSANEYQYVQIPKKNFIIKRGGIADIKALINTRVIVKGLRTKGDRSYVILEHKDGVRFFGSHKTLKAYFVEGIKRGELLLPN